MDGFEIAARTLKSLAACLVAAMSGIALWGLFTLIMAMLGWPSHASVALRLGYWAQAQWPAIAGIFLLILFVMVVFAMPVQAVLQMFGQAGYVATVMVAIVLGAAVFHWTFDFLTTVGYDDEMTPPSKLHPEWLAGGAGIGFYLGSVAWLIRRPDKDGKAVKQR